ncbi:MAG: leucine-rich repeat domain-containing protein [Clostridiaceae bacterium]|nr:leucine-rich repeat domain-containing protein [Clostridiaceae bacterium]
MRKRTKYWRMFLLCGCAACMAVAASACSKDTEEAENQITVEASYDTNLRAILGEGLIYEVLEDADEPSMTVATYNDVALEDITIPNTVIYQDTEYQVTQIGESAFESNVLLQKITIPEGVTVLDTNAFYSCPALTEVVLPDTLESIGESCFAECPELSEINLPDSLQSLGQEAFCNCTALEKITVPANANTMGNGVFYGCEALTECVFEDGVTQIGAELFTNCYELSTVTIPDSVTKIGTEAFWSCTALKSMELSENVTEIGDGAFYGSGITQLTIHSKQLQPEAAMLNGCADLVKLYVPEEMVSTYETVFEYQGYAVKAI